MWINNIFIKLNFLQGVCAATAESQVADKYDEPRLTNTQKRRLTEPPLPYKHL